MLTIAVLLILTFLTFSTSCKEGFTGLFWKIALADLLIFIFWLGISMTEPKWLFPEEEKSVETARLIRLSRPKTNPDAEIIYSAEKIPRYFDIRYQREGAALEKSKGLLVEGKDIFFLDDPGTKEVILSITKTSKKARLGWWFFPSLPFSEETFHVVLPKKYKVE